jgi:hypothetical protein
MNPLRRRAGLALLTLAVGATPALADEGSPLTISGSTRIRYEALHGQARTGFAQDDDIVNMRTSIVVDYKLDPNWRLGVEIMDSRVYGQDRQSSINASDVNTIEPAQAYIAGSFQNVLAAGDKLAVQAGRMLLNIGSRRLIAADDYRTATPAFTGVRSDWQTRGGLGVTMLYVVPQQRRPDDRDGVRDNRAKLDREHFDQQLWLALVSQKTALLGATTTLTYTGFIERDQPGRPTRDRRLHNLSAWLIRDPAAGQFDFEVEGIYQFGHVSASNVAGAPRLDVSAWFLHAEAGYGFGGPLGARLAFEYDHASGDGRGARFGRFDTLFGTRRGDLAPSSLYGQIARANVIALGPRVEVQPTKRLDAFVTYRALWLANRYDAFSGTGVRDATGRSGRFAGDQIDGRVRWWVVPTRLRAEVNAVWLGKARFLELAPNAAPRGDVRYISTALTASF